MNTKKYQKNSGFTIMEVIISVAILTVIIVFVSSMLTVIFDYSKQGLLAMDNIDQARTISSTFVNEIRDATPGNDGSYPLNKATASEIIFYTNYKTSSSAIVNRVRYFISNNKLYKGTVIPTGSPLSYNLSSESVKLIQSDIRNASTPLFYYYDGDYDGTTSALTQPVNINQVRFARINLMVLTQTKKGDSSVFTVTTGATIRSIKDNLGN